MIVEPLDFFANQFGRFNNFCPHRFLCDDSNMRAFDSADSFLSWFKQPPGPPGNPCRDELFYIRELSRISQNTKPDSILEIGTFIGIGTLILRILNPDARIVTVDNRAMLPAADNNTYPVGFIALLNQCKHHQLVECSATMEPSEFQMVFIDGDHSYEAVKHDSDLALKCVGLHNGEIRSIVWHDYAPATSGVIAAVNEFCGADNRITLNKLPDSGTVWVDVR